MNLSGDDRVFLVETIRRFFPDQENEIFLFGSFALGTATDRSDVDLAIKGPDKLDPAQWQLLTTEFEEGDFSRSVDIIDYHRVTSGFRQVIDDTGIKIG